jgi:hypothetical protein
MCNILDCWDSFQYAIYWIVGAALNVQFIGLLGQISMCNLLDCLDANLSAFFGLLGHSFMCNFLDYWDVFLA